jgi:hypothetical protein
MLIHPEDVRKLDDIGKVQIFQLALVLSSSDPSVASE